MKALARTIAVLIILSVVLAGSVVADVQVQAQVDRSSPVYAGSRFDYNIIVANGDQPDNVDMTPLERFSPSGPSTQSRTSVVNGRVSSYQILTYQLLATQKGELTIPSVQVTVDGKAYQTNPITVTVVEPGSTEQLSVQMQLSAETCYVGQPVILTISFYVWTDIVRADQIANINIQAPILQDDRFYVEDVDTPPANAKQTILPINGQKEYVYQDQVLHDSVQCVRVRCVKVLIAKQAGTVSADPASVTADLAVSRKTRSRDRVFDSFFGSQYEYKRFGTQSDPLQLAVQGLPQAGKPDDFYGLVGRYEIQADATPKSVNVGDPITLTIRVSGSQYLKAVQWPDLGSVPKMADSFKIPTERSDGKIKKNAKVFTQTIRANHQDVTEIPSIPLSFFDADTGHYRTVRTKPIPLEVAATRVVTGVDVESTQVSSVRKQLKAIQKGLSANYTSSDALVNQRFSLLSAVTGPGFILLYGLPLAVLAAAALIRYVLADSPQRRTANKRRKAYAQAVRCIHEAGCREKASPQVLAAMKQYVADKFDKSAGALTAADCGQMILQKTGQAKLADRYRKIMEQMEASEYSPMACQLTDEKQTSIVSLLAEIEKKVK